MRKALLTMVVALMATVSVSAQIPKRYDTENLDMGITLLEYGEQDEGLKYLEAELKKHPRNVCAYMLIALAEYGKKEYTDALANINKVLNPLPKKEKEFMAAAYMLRAEVYLELNENDKALGDLSKCIALQPNTPDFYFAYVRRGEVYMLQGDEEAAKADCRRVIEMDTVANQYSVAMYAYQVLGEQDKAKEFMQRVIDNAPDNEDGYYDAACLYAQMGEQEQALGYLRQTFEHGYHGFGYIEWSRYLKPVRDMEEFKELFNEYKEKYQRAMEAEAKYF